MTEPPDTNGSEGDTPTDGAFEGTPEEMLVQLIKENKILQERLRTRFNRLIPPQIVLQEEVETLIDMIFFDNPEAKIAFLLEFNSRMRLVVEKSLEKAAHDALTT